MAVAFDAASESHTGTTGSQGEASFTWNHGGASSGVKGALVFVFGMDTSSDFITSVTYGGVSMSAVSGGRAVDSAGEAGSCKTYFLGASVPQGTQAIVVNRTNNASTFYAVAVTVLASTDTSVTGVVLEQGDQALAEENVDDGSPGTNSLRLAGTFSGLANITAALQPGANSTQLAGIDIGAIVAMAVRETTAGQGSRPVGFVGVSDDVAAVYLAVKESGSGTQSLTGALYSKAPTFFTGVVTPGAVALTGSAIYAKTPTFFTGSVTAGANSLAGTLYSKTPTFFVGTVTPGAVALTGTLYSKTPTFFTGAITHSYSLTGVLYSKTPAFFAGTVTSTRALTGTLFSKTPTFFTGTITGGSQPTRLYLGGFDTSPRFYVDPVSYGAQWENTANAATATRRLWRDKPGYGFDQISRSKTPASDTADRLMSILVSNPLAAQTISGTAKAVVRVSENAAGSDLRSQIIIRVMSDDLQTERGILYAGDDGALVTEWSTTVTNRYFPQSGSASLSSVNALDGDRLLVELGYRSHAAGTSGSGTIDLGDDGTDLPDNESNTTQGAPWIEFSQDIVFKDFPHGSALLAEDFTGTNGDPWPAEWDTDSIGVDSAIDINTNAGRAKAGTASTSDSGRAILEAATLNIIDADVYLRFRFDSLEPVSGSPSGAVVGLIWLRGDGTWRSGVGVTDRPIDNGVGFEWWNNRPGTKIVEIFGGTVFHPSTDFECLIRQPVDTADTWTRIRIDGTYAAMKMWQGAKLDEPLDWQIETHDIQVAGPGQVQIVAKRDNANGTVITSMFLDDLDIGDAGAGFVLTGTLFQKTPTFPTGIVSVDQTVTGVLYSKTPTFFAGTVTSTVTLSGNLYQKTPTFFTGTVFPDQALTGVLYQKTPTFFTGTIGQAGTLFGTLFVKAPVFFTGAIAQGAPSFWQPNPVAFTLNPVAYVPVPGPGPSPWGATLSGQRYVKTPTFPGGTIG